MTDLAKLRAETLALIAGTTPGPWRANATFIHGKKYGGMWVEAPELIRITGSGGSQSYTHVVTDIQAHDDNDANARLIAAAPTLAADTLRLLDEIERLRGVLERIETASRHWADYEAAPDAVHYAHECTARLARAALSEGDPR